MFVEGGRLYPEALCEQPHAKLRETQLALGMWQHLGLGGLSSRSLPY
jgi:hypothetical protein